MISKLCPCICLFHLLYCLNEQWIICSPHTRQESVHSNYMSLHILLYIQCPQCYYTITEGQKLLFSTLLPKWILWQTRFKQIQYYRDHGLLMLNKQFNMIEEHTI